MDTAQPEPWQQLEVLRYEIEQYNSELLGRPSAIVANKMDLPKASGNLQQLRQYAEEINLPLFTISAENSKGLIPVLQHIRALYDSSLKNTDVSSD